MPVTRDRDMDALDIKALLQVALDERPRDDVAERVMNRVAAMDTLVEFARLLAIAPIHWLLDDDRIQADRPPHAGERDDPKAAPNAGGDPD